MLMKKEAFDPRKITNGCRCWQCRYYLAIMKSVGHPLKPTKKPKTRNDKPTPGTATL